MRPTHATTTALALMVCLTGLALPPGAQAQADPLKAAATEAGAVVTDSGLVYRSLTPGKGPSPTAADTVKVHYRDTLTDGKEFDSSIKRGQPAECDARLRGGIAGHQRQVRPGGPPARPAVARALRHCRRAHVLAGLAFLHGGASMKRLWLAITLVLLWAAPELQAQDTQPAVQRRIGADTFVFGGSVRIDQPVTGDLIAAGGNVDVDAPVAGDAMLAGGNLRITAKVEQSVHAGGGRLILDAPIGRNLRVGGGQVEIGPLAAIGGNVTVGGGQVTLRGPIKGHVTVGGGRLLIDGVVEGDVESYAGSISLGPNARLAGKLRYRSGNELVRDPAATVAGAVERLALPGRDGAAPAQSPGASGGYAEGSGPSWGWTAGLMAIAALLVAALPVTSMRVADGLRTHLGWSLLWGFIVLVCIPVAALILVFTIIGIPIALLALLLYLSLLLVGYVSSAIGLGQWALARLRADAAQRTGWRIGAAMTAMFLLALLGSVPFIGGFVALAAVVAGIGAIALLLAPRQAAATPA